MRLAAPFLIVLGFALQILAACSLLSAAISTLDKTDNLQPFLISAFTYVLLGALCLGLGRSFRSYHFSTRQMFLTTAGTWIFLSMLGSLPLHITSTHLSFSDALFETVSGLTTTGSTVMTNLNGTPRDILLWRSLLQWIGGVGVICMAVLLLPFLKVGGMRLFQTESSHWEDQGGVPRTRNLVKAILQTYSLLTLLCLLSYLLAGMSPFEAVNHALTTISTGGFSTSDSSFTNFSLGLQWIAIVFMLAGAIPFTLYPALAKHTSGKLFTDYQVRGLLLAVTTFTSLVLLGNLANTGTIALDTLTRSAFNVTSVITTTGYASGDYTLLGHFVIGCFFFATFIGGCSGSTSGGTKIFRIQLFFKLISSQIARTIHPRLIVTTNYSGRPVTAEIVTALTAYFFFMVSSLLILTLALSATNLDLTTSLTGAATAIMNVGPGLGDTIGPAGNFSSLSEPAKLLLCIGMLLGRLEFMTIIILFMPSYWRG